MCKLLIIVCILIVSNIAKSENFDNLKPDAGTLSDFDFQSEYKLKIRKTLLKGLSELPIARVVVCPSFEPEYAISIETENNKVNHDSAKKTYIILRTCDPSIWTCYQHNNDSCIVSSKKIMVDSIFAGTIERLFKTALSQARYTLKPTTGLDGTGYYFMSTVMFEGIHCGFTWSPDSVTKMGGLVYISDILRSYCETQDEKLKKVILKKSNELIIRFVDNNRIEKQSYNERYIWISITSLLIVILIITVIKLKNNAS